MFLVVTNFLKSTFSVLVLDLRRKVSVLDYVKCFVLKLDFYGILHISDIIKINGYY